MVDHSRHALRETTATNTLPRDGDVAEVQVWLGYATIQGARSYDRRKTLSEDSPTFRARSY